MNKQLVQHCHSANHILSALLYATEWQNNAATLSQKHHFQLRQTGNACKNITVPPVALPELLPTAPPLNTYLP